MIMSSITQWRMDQIMRKRFVFWVLVIVLLLQSCWLGQSDGRTVRHTCIHDHLWNENTAEPACRLPRIPQEIAKLSGPPEGIRVVYEYDFVDGCTSVGQVLQVPSTMGCFEHQCIMQDLVDMYVVNNLKARLEGLAVRIQNMLQVLRVKNELDLTTLKGTNPCSQECTHLNIDGKRYTEADLVIYVTTRPVVDGSQAWSLPLAVDQNGRPIAGILNLSPRDLARSHSYIQDDVLLHELVHLLGFSHPVFENILPTTQIGERLYLTESRIIEAMKTHFGCNASLPSVDIPGVELDVMSLLPSSPVVAPTNATKQSERKKKSSHWNKKIFGNELMTAAIHALPMNVLSEVTLTLLEATNWYYVSYAASETFRYGMNEGCSTLSSTKSCPAWQADNAICSTAAQQYGCSADHRFTTQCDGQLYDVALPKAFQHHVNHPFWGGDALNEYCSFMQPLLSCEDSNDRDTLRYGERFGMQSRCFNSSLYHGFGATFYASRCYFHYCSRENEHASLTLNIKLNETWFSCREEDVGTLLTVDGFQGAFECPSVSAYCPEETKSLTPSTTTNSCSNECSVNGTCINGKCYCQTGWTGRTCDVRKTCPIHGSLLECNGHGTCATSRSMEGQEDEGSSSSSSSLASTCNCAPNWTGQACSFHHNVLENIHQVSFPGNTFTIQRDLFQDSWVYFSVQAFKHNQVDISVIENKAWHSSSPLAMYLVGRFHAAPTALRYDLFDEDAWANRRNSHYLSSFLKQDETLYYGIYLEDVENQDGSSHTRFVDVNLSVSVQIFDLQSDQDECASTFALSSPCNLGHGGGTCEVSLANGMQCVCKEGFLGDGCDVAPEKLLLPSCRTLQINAMPTGSWKYFRVHVPMLHENVPRNEVTVSISNNKHIRLFARHGDKLPELGNRETVMDFKGVSESSSHQAITFDQSGDWTVGVYVLSSTGTPNVDVQLCTYQTNIQLQSAKALCSPTQCAGFGVWSSEENGIYGCECTSLLWSNPKTCCSQLHGQTFPSIQDIPSGDFEYETLELGKEKLLKRKVLHRNQYVLYQVKGYTPTFKVSISARHDNLPSSSSVEAIHVMQASIPASMNMFLAHTALRSTHDASHIVSLPFHVNRSLDDQASIVLPSNETTFLLLLAHLDITVALVLEPIPNQGGAGGGSDKTPPENVEESEKGATKQPKSPAPLVYIISGTTLAVALVILIFAFVVRRHIQRRNAALAAGSSKSNTKSIKKNSNSNSNETRKRKTFENVFVPTGGGALPSRAGGGLSGSGRGWTAKSSRIIGSDGVDRWCLAVDPDTGAVYYYNERTRETRWELPELIDAPLTPPL